MGNVIIRKLVFQSPNEPTYTKNESGNLVILTPIKYESSKLENLRLLTIPVDTIHEKSFHYHLYHTEQPHLFHIPHRLIASAQHSPQHASSPRSKGRDTPQSLGTISPSHQHPTSFKSGNEKHDLVAVFIRYPNASITIMYSHATSEDLGTTVQYGAELANELRANVLVYDYSGFGLSQGKSNEMQLYADGDAVLRYLVEQEGISREHIILMGRSLGSAVSIELAKFESSILGTIVVSPIGSIARVLRPTLEHSPSFDLFCSCDKIHYLCRPLLIVHGSEDELVSTEVVYKLHEASKTQLIKSASLLCIYSGVGHNDLELKFREELFALYRKFIQDVCIHMNIVLKNSEYNRSVLTKDGGQIEDAEFRQSTSFRNKNRDVFRRVFSARNSPPRRYSERRLRVVPDSAPPIATSSWENHSPSGITVRVPRDWIHLMEIMNVKEDELVSKYSVK